MEGPMAINIARRKFIAALGSAAAAWPLAARAQRAGGMPKVGVLMPGRESDPDSQARIAAFRQGFADLSWKDGQNVHIEYRWADGKIELIQQYVEQLVALAPDVILANSTPVIEALKKTTSSIPIVFAQVNDPVGQGFVKSLSHPGGNITGFTFFNPEMIGKWVGLLKDVAPGITRAALLFNPSTAPFYPNFLHEIEAARQPGAIEIVLTPVATPAEMEAAIDALAQKPGSSLIIAPDVFAIVHIKQFAQLAEKNRLLAISGYRQFAVEGGLMAYGPDTMDIFRRSAEYVDRILKGANPADLPVQEPIKFEFIVNLKTAQSFGLTMPAGVLSIADEVIE
jgi:putative tryptophan/tyrosine transport system substrate-binding protein